MSIIECPGLPCHKHKKYYFHCPIKNDGHPDASQIRPLKMIEAFRGRIGFWVADFVSREGIGPVCRHDVDELVRLLRELTVNREKLMEYRKRVTEIAPQHTWEMRCRKVAQMLL